MNGQDNPLINDLLKDLRKGHISTMSAEQRHVELAVHVVEMHHRLAVGGPRPIDDPLHRTRSECDALGRTLEWAQELLASQQ